MDGLKYMVRFHRKKIGVGTRTQSSQQRKLTLSFHDQGFSLSTRLSSVLSPLDCSHHVESSAGRWSVPSPFSGPPPTYPRPALLSPASLLLDFERRLSRKIFEVNRTLTALSSELRRSITVENVPNIALERAFAGRLSGKPKTIVSTLEELLVYVPPQMLVCHRDSFLPEHI